MNYQYLTPEDQLVLDPYHLNRDKFYSIPEFGDKYNPPSQWYRISPIDAFSRLSDIRQRTSCLKHAPYHQYMDEMDSKCGPQGGFYSRSKMIEMLERYYSRALNHREVHQYLIMGRDYLLRRIRQIISDFGEPILPPVSLVDTNAACPTGLKKGDYLAEVTGHKPWRHMYPACLGQRRMRNKDRLIFQDSVQNVRYIERELSGVRNWLKMHLPEYFGAWRNPVECVNPILTEALKRRAVFVETDYEAMDEHFSLQIVNEIILPLYEVLIPGSYLSFASAVEELFHSSVYLGDRITVGLHNLFSGEGITNDFETQYTVCLVLGIALSLGCLEDTTFVALGDDCTIALRNRDRNFARKFMDQMIQVSNLADMCIHADEKSRIVVGETRFCRKVYYPSCHQDINGNLSGNYPLNLALNNIVQPERIQSNPALAAVADIQRMDNCYGAPGSVEMIQMLWKYSTHAFSELDPSALNRDWWFRVYGERWTPDSSPTVQLLQKMWQQHHDTLFYTLKSKL